MYVIQASKDGGNLDYLTEAEEEHLDAFTDTQRPFDYKGFEDFCEKNGKSILDVDVSALEQYMNPAMNHEAARVTGGLAKTLNLTYSKELFAKLLAGTSPVSQEVLQEAYGTSLKKLHNGTDLIVRKKNQQLGLSGVANTPKSVAMLYAISSPEEQQRIRNAVLDSVEQINNKIQKMIVPRCDDERYRTGIDHSKTEMANFLFFHYENRGIDKVIEVAGVKQTIHVLEPFIHIHDEKPNVAKFEFVRTDEHGKEVREVKFLAPDFEMLFKSQLEMSAQFDTILNANLNKIGIKTVQEVDPETGFETFRVKGISREQELQLSSRGKEVDAFIEEQKAKGIHYASSKQAQAALKEAFRKATGHHKQTTNANILHEKIRETTLEVLTPAAIESLKIEQKSSQDYNPADISNILKDQLFDLQGEAKETEIRKLINNELRFSKSYTSIEELDRDIDYGISELKTKYGLIQKDNGKFTTLKLAITEHELQQNIEYFANLQTINSNKAANLEHLGKFVQEYNRKNPIYPMNDSQLDTCRLVCEEHRMINIQGFAGVGKTTTGIAFMYDLHKTMHPERKIVGLAVQNTTSKALSEGGFSDNECFNTTSFLLQSKDREGNLNSKFINENANALWVIDEASMVSAEQANELLKLARECNASIACVGDTEQILSVGAGQFINQVRETLRENQQTEMSVVVRQRTQQQRDVANYFRSGEPEKAIDILKNLDAFHTFSNENQLIEQISTDYVLDTAKTKAVACNTNKQVDTLNDAIQKKIIELEAQKVASNPNYKSHLDYNNQVGIVVGRAGKKPCYQEKFFCKGDQIIFLEGIKEKKTGLEIFNSQRAIITNIENKSDGTYVTVDINGSNVSFNATKHNKFSLAHASTKNRLQGASVDSCYNYAQAQTTKNDEYVKNSRHKDKVGIYILDKDIPTYLQNSKVSQQKATTLNDKNVRTVLNRYYKKSAEISKTETKEMPEDFKPKIERDTLLKLATQHSGTTSGTISSEITIGPEVAQRIYEEIIQREKNEADKLKAIEEAANSISRDLAKKYAPKTKEITKGWSK
jgi:hypothetical protein